MLPDFLGIGAQRAATTWIHRCLAEHPEVFVPPEKELNYFGSSFDRGCEWYESCLPASYVHPVRAIGEVSPSYLVAPKAPERMAALVPNARLFVILRDPVDRAYSAFQLFRGERYGRRSFADVCVAGSDLVRQGLYAEHLTRLERYFPVERTRVWLYEDIEEDPGRVLAELFTYLGVDPSVVPPSVGKRFNRVMFSRSQRALGALGLGRVVEGVKGTPVGTWIKRRHAAAASNGPTMEERQVALAFFERDVCALEERLGRDLTPWRS